MPGSRAGPRGSRGRTLVCRSGEGWTAAGVASSWEEERCGGSSSVGWT